MTKFLKDINLKGKFVLITGATKGIGRSTAVAMHQVGASIIAVGRNKNELKTLKKKLRTRIQCVECDVRDYQKISKVINNIRKIDVLVNNAAIRPSAGFIEMSDEDWMRVMNVNFGSVHGLSKAFLPGMVERCYGRIINFTGMHAMRGYVGRAHVSTSKHAVWGLTKSLGREFAAQGVTANVISPGPINGDYEDARTLDGIKATVAQVPANRMGEPSEIAALVKLLVSDEGGYINAQLLQINGGAQT